MKEFTSRIISILNVQEKYIKSDVDYTAFGSDEDEGCIIDLDDQGVDKLPVVESLRDKHVNK